MRVEGILFGWFETGFEGTVWALQADNDPGYGGLFVLNEADHVVIISPLRKFCLVVILSKILKLEELKDLSAQWFNPKLNADGYTGFRKVTHQTIG